MDLSGDAVLDSQSDRLQLLACPSDIEEEFFLFLVSDVIEAQCEAQVLNLVSRVLGQVQPAVDGIR